MRHRTTIIKSVAILAATAFLIPAAGWNKGEAQLHEVQLGEAAARKNKRTR